MTFEQRRAATISSWVLVMAVAGMVLGIATPAGWGILAAIALIPAIVAMRLWTAAPETTSQRINSGRR